MTYLHKTRPRSFSRTNRVARIAHYLILLCVIIAFGLPAYWLFSSSLKENAAINKFPPDWIPRTFHWQNFANAWKAAPFTNFIVNSVIVTSITTVIKITLATLTAYAFVFVKFPFKRALFLFLLSTLMVPGTVVLLPNYLTATRLDWVNTYQGLIIPVAASAVGTFLLRQHMLTIPYEIFEAARVDGASHLRILWQLIVPMSRPMMITATLVSLVEVWNDFIWPLIITNTTDMRTLPIGLLFLQQQEGSNDWGAILAGSVIVALPMLVLFLFAQRYIVRGFAGGALKG